MIDARRVADQRGKQFAKAVHPRRTRQAQIIPGAEKIFPLVEGFYLPANEYLLTCATYTHKTLEQPVKAINRIRGRARFWLKFLKNNFSADANGQRVVSERLQN